MEFEINLTASAIADLNYFRKSERQKIVEAVTTFLGQDADVEGRRRKRLRLNQLSEWELRIGTYRVFYNFEANGQSGCRGPQRP
ncbi:type II toxin-antitoxin system RelE family toxin [Phormidesmis priestleyi]